MSTRVLKVGPAAVSGNGVVLDVRRERRSWVVEFMAESRNSPESLWFHLQCTGAGGRKIRFAWLNAHVCLGTGSAEAMANVRPVVRLDNGDWQRINEVEVVERPTGGHFLTFATPTPCRRAAVAFCYPYGPDELDATLKETGGFWEVEAIGLSAKGRQLLRLHAHPDRERRGRPGAYVVARQHSGETPGSWVLDGLLRAVAAEEPPGRLRGIEWWIVPFVDIDGAVEGNYGKDTLPIDFNRAWSPMPMRPEVHAIQSDLRYFAASRSRRFVLDLHGPGGGETRMYQFQCREDRPKAHRKATESFTPFGRDSGAATGELGRGAKVRIALGLESHALLLGVGRAGQDAGLDHRDGLSADERWRLERTGRLPRDRASRCLRGCGVADAPKNKR